jgi:hypothetical protein
MYCSLQEAWPEYNNTTSHVSRSSVPVQEIKDIKNVREIHSVEKKNNNFFEHFNEENSEKQSYNHIGCNNFLDHLSSCHRCQQYISSKFSRNNSFSKLFEMHPQLKETVLVFLIGIVILMVLNLLTK